MVALASFFQQLENSQPNLAITWVLLTYISVCINNLWLNCPILLMFSHLPNVLNPLVSISSALYIYVP